MSGLPEGLHKKLHPGTVLFEHEVAAIEIDSQTSAKVQCRTPTGTKEFQVPFVICTIPFSVLRLVSLVNFSYAKVKAIRDMSYINSTKVGFACKSRFWEAKYGICGGSSVSDRIQRQTYYPMDHDDRARDSRSPPLTPGGPAPPAPLFCSCQAIDESAGAARQIVDARSQPFTPVHTAARI